MDESQTFEEFEQALKAADWLHPLSDDHGVWSRGERQCEGLRITAMRKGGKWQEAYEAISGAAWARVHE